MTREEAIKVLKMVECHGSLTQEAKEMAISALSDKRILLSDEELKKVRDFLVDNVFRNPYIVLACVDIARGDIEGIDLVDLIASLYDMLHLVVTGKHYDYMWHWCNKVGGWCDDLALYKLLDIKDNEKDIIE